MDLAPEAEEAGFRLLSLGSTDSTNEDALRAARDGDPGLLWVVAAEQRAGRGRHGRAWASPPGNLYASLLLMDPCPPADAPQLGFVAGLALHRAVESVTGIAAPRLSLKWPNDLLLDGAKVSGLLVEGHRIAPGQGFAAIVGLGVNVAIAPSGTPYPAAALREITSGATSETLFTALSRFTADALTTWRRDGFAAIRRAWLDRAAGIGTEIALRLPSGESRGRFQGLDPAGRLLLGRGGRVESIDAGDLYFPQAGATTAEAPDHLTGS